MYLLCLCGSFHSLARENVSYNTFYPPNPRGDLTPLITWQLCLARELVKDYHLPWQKPQVNLTPGRVAHSMFGLLVEIGIPTIASKPRGKSPGWEKDKKRQKRKLYPAVKKRKSSQKKGENNRLGHNFDLIYTSLSYFLMAESFCHGINFRFSDRRLGKHLV